MRTILQDILENTQSISSGNKSWLFIIRHFRKLWSEQIRILSRMCLVSKPPEWNTTLLNSFETQWIIKTYYQTKPWYLSHINDNTKHRDPMVSNFTRETIRKKRKLISWYHQKKWWVAPRKTIEGIWLLINKKIKGPLFAKESDKLIRKKSKEKNTRKKRKNTEKKEIEKIKNLNTNNNKLIDDGKKRRHQNGCLEKFQDDTVTFYFCWQRLLQIVRWNFRKTRIKIVHS